VSMREAVEANPANMPHGPSHILFMLATFLTYFLNKGQFLPYELNPTKPAYYVRRGATTFPARQEEARALARSDLIVSPLPSLMSAGGFHGPDLGG